MKYPTKTIKKSSPYASHIENGDFIIAGPNPNITGMRKHFWGKDAPIVKIGKYIYKVDPITYENCK